MGVNWYTKDVFNLFLDAMKTGIIPPNESSEEKEKRIDYEIEIKDSIGQKRKFETMSVDDDASPVYPKGCSFSTFHNVRIYENDSLTETTICYYFSFRSWRASSICVPLRVCKGTPFKIHECLKIFRDKNHKGLW